MTYSLQTKCYQTEVIMIACYEDSDQYTRSNTLEIQGIPESKTEDVYEVVRQVGVALDVNFTRDAIDVCHRLGKRPDSNRPAGIIVKFVRREIKLNVLERRRVKRNLNTKDVGFSDVAAEPDYINESLSPSKRKLLAAARTVKRGKNYAYLWVRNGKIFMRKNPGDSVIVITSIEQIEKLYPTMYEYLAHSPTDSDPEGWLFDTLAGTDVQVADQELWQSGDGDLDPGGPLEYRTLFDCRGFIFNIGQANGHSPSGLKPPRPTLLPLSPSPEQLATLLHPSSPSDHHLAAVLRTPLPCPSLEFLRCIEVDPGALEAELAAPRGRFLRAASNLHTRLLDLDSETSCLVHQGILLKVDFQELLATTDYLVSQARRLQQDLQDVLYLNDLLWMLRGRLERVSKRRWPFLEAHVPLGVREEANLVV